MTINKYILVEMYGSGKSMTEIATTLQCSVHKIVYWMEKHNIPRRNHSDAAYRKENPSGDPFRIKTNRTAEEQLLYGLAMGLFWGEGTKATKHSVRLTNTDPAMIKVFRSFLVQICQVPLTKIHYSLVTFNDVQPDQAAAYWARELGISHNEFGTIVSIPPQGKGSYKRKSQYGVCSITVSNIKLKAWMMNQLEEIKQAWIV